MGVFIFSESMDIPGQRAFSPNTDYVTCIHLHHTYNIV